MTVEISNIPTWQTVVDWNNDADFSDTTEDISAYLSAAGGMSIELGLDSARAFSPPRIGRARNQLLNNDKIFSAESPASPVYQLMLPGRPVEHRVTIGLAVDYDSEDWYYDDNILYDGADQQTVFTGIVEDMPQHPEQVIRRVTLSAVGTLAKLRGRRREGRKISTALYTSVSTGTCVGYILDILEWPAAKRSIDTGSTTLLYWWLDEEEPYKAILDLLAVEGPQAAFYEDSDGVLHFEGRNYRQATARCLTSQAVIYDRSNDGPEATYENSLVDYDGDNTYEGDAGVYHSEPFSYDQGFKNVINAVTVETVQRTQQSLAVVWTYAGGNITLAANAVFTITAKPSSPVNAAVCTNGVDATVSAGSLASTSLSRTSGGNIEITLTAGAGGATVNLLQLRAVAFTVSSTVDVRNSVDAATSIDVYDQQDLRISARTDLDVNTAQAVADAIVNRYSTALPVVTLTIINHNFNHLYEQFTRRISDRLTVYESHTGVAWDGHINQITHSARDGGKFHYTTLACEKVPTSAEDLAYVWDAAVSVWGTAIWAS